MPISFTATIPVLRVFDTAKADEFYLGFLGFEVRWAHRFDANAPLYREIARDGLVLHLSEHHGDGCPGGRLRVMMRGIEDFQRELIGKNYRFMRPGLQTTPWNTLETNVIDPFGTMIIFCQPLAGASSDDR